MSQKPVALFILDGWGIREMAHGNAVVQAHTPNYDRWLRTRERARPAKTRTGAQSWTWGDES